MAVYPTGIVGTGTLITIIATEPTNNPSHTGQHNNINGEVIAIETALGTSPQGSYATVSAALTTHGTLITAAQTTATSGVVNALAAQTTANTAVAAASAAQTTANTAVAAAATAQTTANARATYPGAGVPFSTGSAWSTSYTVGTATGNLMLVNGLAAPSVYYPYIKITNTQPQNTNGGAITAANTFETAILNTKDNDTAGIATLTTSGAAYTIAVSAGTYLAKAWFPLNGSAVQGQIRLYNTTGSTYLINGINSNECGNTNVAGYCMLTGLITSTSALTMTLQYAVTVTSANGQGIAYNFGPEVFATVELTKIG